MWGSRRHDPQGHQPENPNTSSKTKGRQIRATSDPDFSILWETRCWED